MDKSQNNYAKWRKPNKKIESMLIHFDKKNMQIPRQPTASGEVYEKH